MTIVGTPGAALMDRLVNRAGGIRREATIQSDVRMLLLDSELGLADDKNVQLRAQVGKGRRIDVEVGCTVIEVKKSLHSAAEITPAVEQLTECALTTKRAVRPTPAEITTHT